jgi:hypothetical protein
MAAERSKPGGLVVEDGQPLIALPREVVPYSLTYAVLARYGALRRRMRPPHGPGLIEVPPRRSPGRATCAGAAARAFVCGTGLRIMELFPCAGGA